MWNNLGQEGHRRLNVLFTRAKKRVEVFSSLQANNIITDGVSWGVKVLRQYLEFAKSDYFWQENRIG
jgi:superfamily I DNA and/or RNA helicase